MRQDPPHLHPDGSYIFYEFSSRAVTSGVFISERAGLTRVARKSSCAISKLILAIRRHFTTTKGKEPVECLRIEHFGDFKVSPRSYPLENFLGPLDLGISQNGNLLQCFPKKKIKMLVSLRRDE